MQIPLQAVALLCAGYVLWRLWRVSEPIPKLLRYLVVGGFLIRAFAGQLLFWVSWLELPFGRSLQLGNGLWFFGLDALSYFGPAAEAGESGLAAILKIRPSLPSVVFVRLLALFAWLFGSVVSVAILLNVVVYLGIAVLIIRWAAQHDVPEAVTAVAIFAVGYLPSWVLWALQPLKDAFFCFLIILFAFAVDRFLAAWKRPPGARAAGIAGTSVFIVLATYLLAGVRWYYAAMALGTAALVCLSILFVRRGGRELALRAGVLALVGFTSAQIFVTSAGPYAPAPIVAMVRPWVARKHAKPAVVRGVAVAESRGNSEPGGIRGMAEVVEESRNNIERYAAAGTTIRSGRRLERLDEASAPPVATRTQPATSAPKETTPPAQTAVSKPAQGTPPAKNGTAPKPPAAAPGASVATVDAKQAAERALPPLPETRRQRILAGAAALLLPRSVAVKLELVSIGGGRGMWWFAELDTILFDIVLLIVLGLVLASLRRGAWRDPFVWYLILVSGGIAGALAYTISNYGTLLRHRGMVVATVVLLALAVRRCSARKSAASDDAPVPELVPRVAEMPRP